MTDKVNRLILLCLRSDECLGSNSEIEEILSDNSVDWSGLVTEASRHRVVPLVLRVLNNVSSGSNKSFASAVEDLKRIAQANSVRNVFLISELAVALQVLTESGVQVVPIKGPLLAESAYGDISLRQFDDLDLLIEEDQIQKALDVLIAEGYSPRIEMSDHERRMHIMEGWGCALASPAGEYYLELDSSIVPRNYAFELSIKDLESRSVELKVDGKVFKSPCVEDQVHMLCVHGGKHLWERLLWLCDLDGLIRRNPDLDWNQVINLAKKTGTMRLLLLGLFLVKKFIGTTIPSDLSRRIAADSVVRELAEYAERYMEGVASSFGGWRETMPFNLKSRERIVDRITVFCRFLFRPSYSDWKALKLPQSLHFLYYLFRPFRILFRISR